MKIVIDRKIRVQLVGRQEGHPAGKKCRTCNHEVQLRNYLLTRSLPLTTTTTTTTAINSGVYLS